MVEVNSVNASGFAFANTNYQKLSNVIEFSSNARGFYNIKAFFKTVSGAFGFSLLMLVILVAIIVPFLTRSPTFQFAKDLNVAAFGRGPSGNYYVLGTNSAGIDIFARLMHGLRISLLIALAATAIDIIVGCVIGMLMGYFPAFRRYLEFIIKIVSNVPSIIIFLILSVLLKPSLFTLIFSLTILGWITMATLVSTRVTGYKQEQYTTASRIMATPIVRILVGYIPLLLPIILTQLASSIVGTIISETSISVLGLGVPNLPTIGSLIQSSRNSVIIFPLLLLWPLIALFSISLSLQFLRQGIQTVLLMQKR